LKVRGFPLQKTTHQRQQSCKRIGCDDLASWPCSDRAINSLLLYSVRWPLRRMFNDLKLPVKYSVRLRNNDRQRIETFILHIVLKSQLHGRV